MSLETERGIKLSIALFVAAVLQAVFAERMSLFGARPDLILAMILSGGLFCNTNSGAALGFFGGLFHASLASPPHNGFGSLIVSRTLVGFAVGWFEERVERQHPLIAFGLITGGTFVCEILFFLFSPQRTPLYWIQNALFTTLYNALISVPLFYLMRVILTSPEERKTRF